MIQMCTECHQQIACPCAHARAEKAEAEVARLREALDIIATCPPEAVHLMPLAAQAALGNAS